MHLLLQSDSSNSSSDAGRNWMRLLFAAIALLSVFVAVRTIFFVDESEFVYVTEFGQPVRFHYQPGLRIKWPHQSLRRFDRRLQVLEPPAQEMLTEDKENLNFAWYICWRLPGLEFVAGRGKSDAVIIEEYARRFMEALGGIDVAENRLEERVQAALAAEIGRTRLTQLVTLDGEVQLDAIAQRVTNGLKSSIADQFGIEIVDIRLKRFTYPEGVKPAVFAEIRSERERVAVQYRAQGASEKAKIQSLADLQRDQLLAQARREALTIRGAADAKAIEIFNKAHSQDPKFYQLLKTLETYRSMLDDQTTVVLSTDSPLLKILSEGVPEPAKNPAATLEPEPKQSVR